MYSLGGADGPSELSSKIRSLKTGVGSGMPFTQGRVWQHGWREDLARKWGLVDGCVEHRFWRDR